MFIKAGDYRNRGKNSYYCVKVHIKQFAGLSLERAFVSAKSNVGKRIQHQNVGADFFVLVAD